MEKMDRCNYRFCWGSCVINPGELKFGYYFIFPLLSALFLSIRDLVTKNMKTEHNSLQIAFITCLVVTIFLDFFQFINFTHSI